MDMPTPRSEPSVFAFTDHLPNTSIPAASVGARRREGAVKPPVSRALIPSAVRRVSAAIVRVGKVLLARMYRLSCAQLRISAFTTDRTAASPIRQVPTTCPAP